MNRVLDMFIKLQGILDALRAVDFLAPLALRLYLVPVFWMAGTKKFAANYFVMLLVLCFIGAGRFLSVDYWLSRRFGNREALSPVHQSEPAASRT